MTVQELRDELAKHPADAEVMVSTHNEDGEATDELAATVYEQVGYVFVSGLGE